MEQIIIICSRILQNKIRNQFTGERNLINLIGLCENICCYSADIYQRLHVLNVIQPLYKDVNKPMRNKWRH